MSWQGPEHHHHATMTAVSRNQPTCIRRIHGLKEAVVALLWQCTRSSGTAQCQSRATDGSNLAEQRATMDQVSARKAVAVCLPHLPWPAHTCSLSGSLEK